MWSLLYGLVTVFSFLGNLITMLTLTLFCSAPAVTLLGLLIRHVVWNYGCCYCLPCCQPEPPPKIKRLAAALDSIETYRWAVD